jgi:hypothetical protein
MTDKEFINSPIEWPRWPLCPLKRKSGDFHRDDYCGFVIADKHRKTVYLGYIFGLPSGKLSDAIAPLEKIEYATIDEMLEVWRVD